MEADMIRPRRYVQEGLTYALQDARALAAHVECVEDSQALRDLLPGLGLVAFVANGSILPRHACPPYTLLHVAWRRHLLAAASRSAPPPSPLGKPSLGGVQRVAG